MTATFDEKKHRRHPRGAPGGQGGEFAAKDNVVQLRPKRTVERGEISGFPAGEFDPTGKVVFWPEKPSLVDGEPFWKAWMDPNTGEEKAFWFVSDMGGPHHLHMATALGIDPPTEDEVRKGPLRVSGYGMKPDMDWLTTYLEQDMGLDRDIASYGPYPDLLKAKIGEILNRHRKDILDAEIMARGPERLAASALFDQLAEAEKQLQRKYELVIRRSASRAKRAYREAMKVLQAAGQPQPEEILAAEALLKSFLSTTGLARRNLLSEILVALGVLYTDAETPNAALAAYIELLEAQAGVQASRLVAGTQDAVADVLLDAMTQGWTVPQTAQAIEEKLVTVAPWQATMLARTDMVALANGASLKRAVILDSPELQFKTWLATPDERTRIDHRHAHGQTVPLDQPFTVGGESLLYPGDPAASDGNVINCRCTVIYSDSPQGPPAIGQVVMKPDLAISAAGWDETKHERHPKGSDRGGEFRAKQEAAWARGEAAPGGLIETVTTGFPPGEFDPDGKVKFWPKKMGAYSGFIPDAPYGPFWKAITDRDNGEEVAFWFATGGGYPHHADMFTALGLGQARYRDDLPPQFGYYAGYGDTGEAEWKGGTSRDVQTEREIVRRHQRDIRDANAYLPENQAMQAAGWDESDHPREPAGSEKGGQFAPALTAYTANSFNLNDALRHGQALGAREAEQVEALDRLIDEEGEDSTDDMMTVYRGLPRKLLKSGQYSYTELGYLSTTEDPDEAEYFTGEDGEVLEIRVPEGQRFYRVPPGAYDEGYDQKEVIFPRGAELRQERDGTYTVITRYTKPDILRAAAWDPNKHPRHPRGDQRGGEFAPKRDLRGQALLDEISRQRAERAAKLGRVAPEYDEQLKGMWSADADEYIFDPDDPFYSWPIWKAIQYSDGSWKFWITNKDGFPHHQAVNRRIGRGTNEGAFFSGDRLRPTVTERGGTKGFLELPEVLARHAGKYRAAEERASRALAASGWVEAQHPRFPKGTEVGGQFRSKWWDQKAYDRAREGTGRVDRDNLATWEKEGALIYHVGPWAARESIAEFGLVPGGEGVGEANPGQYWTPDPIAVYGWSEIPGTTIAHDVAMDNMKEWNINMFGGEDEPRDPELEGTVYRFRVPPEEAHNMGLSDELDPVYMGVVPPEHIEVWDVNEKKWRPVLGGQVGEDGFLAAGWDESQHPRHPAGSELGGQFAPKGYYYGVRLVPGEGYQAYRMQRGYPKGSTEGRFDYGAITTEAEAQAEAHAGYDAEELIDWGPAEREFEKWAAEMERWYGKPFPPDYFPKQKQDLWRRYQEGVITQGQKLAARLGATGVEGIRLVPELNPGNGGDLDQLMDTSGTFAADFDVSIPGAKGYTDPGFTVWNHADGTIDVEDVLDITDTDFFPDGPDSELVTKYVALVDAARALPEPEGYVTLYRGMSDAEMDAWHAGEEIPLGKFFTSIPTVQYAADRHAQPPHLQTFRVPAHMVTQVDRNEFQLKKKGRLHRGEIVQASALLADGVPYTGGGGMVCLYPTEEEAQAIAREKGQPAEDLHVTLLYFPDGVPGDAAEAVADLEFEGLEGTISGIARFAENDDGVPIVGIVSAVGLNELRADLARALPGASEAHGFVPHITLGYDYVKDEQGAVGLPVTFSAVKVKNKGAEPVDALTAAGWDESQHPRWPAGSERGGEFAPKEIAVEARLGQQALGGYKVSKAPNLREWLRTGTWDTWTDILESWPKLNSMQAARLREFLLRDDVKRVLDQRGNGKLRQEAKWVLRDLGEDQRLRSGPGPAPPTETLRQQGYARSLTEIVEIGGGQNAGAMLEAVRLVDSTTAFPKVPGQPTIPMRGVPRRGRADAQYHSYSHTNKPARITVKASPDVVSNVVHELGHYFDHLLGQDDWSSKTFRPARADELRDQMFDNQRAITRASREEDYVDPVSGRTTAQIRADTAKIMTELREVAPPPTWNYFSSHQAQGTLKPVVDAIKNTDMYKRLESPQYHGTGRGNPVFEYGGRAYTPGAKHIAYLMHPEEMIARSFEQYVAAKNPSSPMARTQRHAFSDTALMPPQYPGYMVGEDLRTVNAAWDKVLTERGLLKNQGFVTPTSTSGRQFAMEND